MAASRAKIAAAVVLMLLIGMGGVAVVWEVFLTPAEPEAASTNPSPARAEIAASTNLTSFEQAYALRG